jgi:hypothetical protein
MSLKPKKLKDAILESGRKVGILIEKGSDADRVLSRGTRVAATVVNESEKHAKSLAAELESSLDHLRAKVHEATAPRTRRKQR